MSIYFFNEEEKELHIMKAMITGMNGTVAPYIYEALINKNIEVIIWDRSQIDITTQESVFQFIEKHHPDIFFHIATGPIEWVEYIAKATKQLNIKLVFTSTVSVFSEDSSGPYTISSIPDAQSEYGKYKIQCEAMIRKHHQDAIIVRLGWQIGIEARPNNMFHTLTTLNATQGFIVASSQWFPSCSFLSESAKCVVYCAFNHAPGTYMANSNTKYSFFDIVKHLKEEYHTDWIIKETTTPHRDDRMFDERISIKELF
jgi:dTDP-4-dehydrorhamnose reductase